MSCNHKIYLFIISCRSTFEVINEYAKYFIFQAKISLVFHGESGSEELITLPHNFGIGLSNRYVLDLEAAWAVSELNEVRFKTKC